MQRNFMTCALLALTLCLSCPGAARAYTAHYGFTGLLAHKEGAFQGYTLFAPLMNSKTVYLLDMEGEVVHTWNAPSTVFYAELLPGGNILAAVRAPGVNALKGKEPIFFGGEHGRIVEMDWDGNMVWDVTLDTPRALLHHGFDRMSNGNTLVLAWERRSWDEARAKGRRDALIPPGPVAGIEGIWPDVVLELDKAGNVVWEWHAMDHAGLGKDELDINFTLNLKAFGPKFHYPDWTHFNSVRHNPATDQILLSSRAFGEIYIVDKKSGRIVWRWGNPGAYGEGRLPGGYGDDGEQALFGNHDANWLPNGNITVFDNGVNRPSGGYSRVLELNPKTGSVVWEYAPPKWRPDLFYAPYQGACQKLPNNNWLITSTQNGQIFEVTPDKRVVWEYVNPVFSNGIRAVDATTPRSMNWVHRAFRYAADHPAFKGRDLRSGNPLSGQAEPVKLMAPYLKAE